MSTVRILWPAAWCFAPLRSTNMVAEPDPPRWPDDGGLDWRLIADTVADAIQIAQRDLTDPLTAAIEVETGALNATETYKVDEWLSVALPEFDPAVPEVTNGRHRTWYARQSGATEAPVLNATAADALRHWHDHDELYGSVDAETLSIWGEYRAWWDLDIAATWSTRNRTHLRLWDSVLGLWSERLGNPRTRPQA